MTTRNKTVSFFNFALAALIGIAVGMPLTLQAHDTDIYLGDSALSTGVNPNVLFILDTSGSMSSKDGGSISRINRMKNALYQILDDVNNINVGLMRFSDPGGPILFPVSYIDEDVTVIEGTGGGAGTNINVQVSAFNDDAEESTIDGSMDLTSTALEVMETMGAVGTSIFRQVSSQANNAEQLVSNGDIITKNQIDLQSSQTNAARFENLTIPPNATILDARIQFTARASNSSNTDWTIYGDANVNPPAFSTSCSGCYDVSGRTKTSAAVPWSPNAWSTGESGPDTQSPNLKDIVQEIVGAPAGPATGWSSGNHMVFIQTHGGSGARRAYTYQGSAAQSARLVVSYTTSTTTRTQKIGLRFQNVGIPQGATIKSAVLEFRPSASSASNTDATIYGDKTLYGLPAALDAAPFAAVTNNISNRVKTLANVPWMNIQKWDVPALPAQPPVYQTPDLSTIVAEIVNDSAWCGNNAMGFILEVNGNTGPRIAEAYDNDPSFAPILRVDWDEASVAPDACINQWTQIRVGSGSDDAEETISSGSISTAGSQFDMRASQVNGLRFSNIQIPQGATILEANLTFTTRSTDTGASTLRFSNQAHDDAPAFSNNNKDISNRTKGVSVDWDPVDWDTVGQTDTTPDLATLVQDVVNRAGWMGGNSLVIIQEHISGARRRAYTVNGSAANAPVLRIKFNGSLTGGPSGTGTKTVRQKLKEIIAGFDANGYTPIVDTLYEAARYYRSEPLLYGARRGYVRDGTYSPEPNSSGSNPTVRQNTRLSHAASYTGGTANWPLGCSETNLNDPSCRDRVVTGSPVYSSPITEACQASYIVLLTDGYANHNHSENLVKSMTGVATCAEGNANENCGRDLVKYLNTTDQATGPTSPTGDQMITTYTIGFNFSSSWLQNMAIDGGGSFYTADTSNELVNAFKAIIADILARTTSFATPSLSVNAFNKLFHRNDVYFSLFKPSGKVRWDGNVKKYQLCSSASLGCSLGEVLDANGDPAVNAANAIRDEALSLWSSGTDGAEIEVGGAGNEIPPAASRNVYTFTSGSPPVLPGADLSASANLLTDGNALVTKTLLGDPLMSNTDRTNLINWIRGLDVDDEDGDGNTTENRYAFNDPLHSSPVAVTYGGTEADPVMKLFVGTNDGGVRMLNAAEGTEEWIFYPQETLKNQAALRPNPNLDHVYGIDGTPSVWLNDENLDGVIDPNFDGNSDGTNESVKLFVGMRRGGDKYYALNVTPSTGTGPLTDPLLANQVAPTLMWRIEGGASAPGGSFPRLGQSWSQPKLATIALGTTTAGISVTKTVLIFAGGYDDTTQENSFGPGGLGNAIYIVDPTDGSRLFWVSGFDHTASDGVTVPGMDYPIPSDLSLMDSDGDGITDRLYVGDVGGNVWRVDLRANATTTAGIKATVGKLATVSDGSNPVDQRKFFYKPDVVQAYEQAFSNVGRYDLVTINTGNRTSPLDVAVQDRFYAFRDYQVTDLKDDGSASGSTAGDGLADGYGKCDGASPPNCTPLQGKTQALAGDLFDATSINDPLGVDLTALQNADGYFIDFESNGEKGLASPVILGGTAFFTSYLPEGVVSSATCSLAEGSGLLYAINVLNGAAVYPNWDNVGDDSNLTKADRTYTLGGGIPSSAVPIFQEEGITLLIGGGGGATTIDPNLTLPRARTYWGQEE